MGRGNALPALACFARAVPTGGVLESSGLDRYRAGAPAIVLSRLYSSPYLRLRYAR
jgi:hypothetical protein